MPLHTRAFYSLLGALLLVSFAGSEAQQQPAPSSQKPSLIGQHAPEILRQDLKQQTISLAKLRGRVVLLNFWASWCGPCLAEMPRFDEWTRKFGEKDFAVIGISIDDDATSAQKAVEKLKIHYPVAMGDAKLGSTYGGILGVPITYLIDRKGVIRARYEGETDSKMIEAKVQELLKQ
jgi:peroxiredoxin